MSKTQRRAVPARLQVWRELAAYLLLAFATVCTIVMLGRGGGMHSLAALTPMCMLTPMLCAFLVQKIARRRVLGSQGLGLVWGRLSLWFLSPLAVAALGCLSIGISLLISPGLAASPAEVVGRLARLTSSPLVHGPANQLGLAVAVTFFVGPLLNLPIFLGEEIGWRGFMNPRLVALFGRPGLLIGGAVWALWHVPLILLGHNYPQHPWVGLMIWVPICICLNLLLEAVRRQSGSIFPSALAHGALNQCVTLGLVLFVREDRFVDILHGPAGLVGLVVFLGPAVLAYRSLARDTPIKPVLALDTGDADAVVRIPALPA